jgi:hypothetical protein
MIHMASVWVPFTSESKEAIADYDEIRKEMKLALMECGRKLGTYLRKRAKMKRESERRDVFERYIGEISMAVNALNGTDTKKLYEALLAQAKKRTAIADMQLDDEGKKVKDEDPEDQEGVLIVESASASGLAAASGAASSATESEPKGKKGPRASLDDVPVESSTSKKAKAAAAALKVAAMQHDDEPALIDVKPAKRATNTERPRRGQTDAAPAKKPAKAPAKPEPKAESKPAPRAEAKPQPEPPAKKPKPRMRLNPKTGKMEPVDEGPGLF